MTTADPGTATAARRPVLTMRRFLGAGSVMLLLILAGVPGVEGEDIVTLNTVHTRLTAAFDGARANALGSGRPHGVAIDVVGDRFVPIDEHGKPLQQVDIQGKPLPAADGWGAPAPASLKSMGADVVSARFGKGGATAVFGRDGLPLAGGEVVVKIGQVPVTWVLDAATGRLLPAED